jgi:hypothetical protein
MFIVFYFVYFFIDSLITLGFNGTR